MKHITLCQDWQFSEDPFPAFRASLIFGRNKRDLEFLPVKDVALDEEGLLPEDKFRVIKTREKGTILIVPGTDTTNRCLGMVGVSDGFRGGSGLEDEHTTAQILKTCQAGNACEGRFTCIALFEEGQQVVLWRSGRRCNDVIVVEFAGGDLVETVMTRREFEACKVCEEIEGEVL